jgi:hypothetical protein
MSSALRRLYREKHAIIALQAYWQSLHFVRTGVLTATQIEASVLALAVAQGIPHDEAAKAIRKGTNAARKRTAPPDLNDPLRRRPGAAKVG